VLVSDFGAGTDIPLDGHVGGNGALFLVNPQNGVRTMLSDFGNSGQGPTGVQISGVAVVPSLVEGDVLVISPFTGTDGAGELVSVNPTTGARAVVSDFGLPAQGATGFDPVDVGLGPEGDVLVVDEDLGGLGVLFSVNPANGARTILSNFSNAAQGPTAGQPWGVVLESSGTILVALLNGGTSSRGAIMRIDPVTGMRTLVSDFGDAAQGPIGISPASVDLGVDGSIFVIDPDATTSVGANGLLFRVDPVTGNRSLVSDFRLAGFGPTGIDPIDLAVSSQGQILVADMSASPALSGYGVLFAVDATTGNRTIISDFGNATLGPTGLNTRAVAIEADGNILVADNTGGTGVAGALFRVNPASGTRVRISDFGNAAQGPTGAQPFGLVQFKLAGVSADSLTVTKFVVTPTALTLSWADSAMRNYTVEKRTSLSAGSWLPVAGVNWPIIAHSIMLPPQAEPNAFFRVRAE
jgi:hypothetical protein